MDINLNIGDIVVDVTTGDVGLLLQRYSLLDEFLDPNEEHPINLWAWDIFWTGPNPETSENVSRYQPYTEEGLFNLIRTGTFKIERAGNYDG